MISFLLWFNLIVHPFHISVYDVVYKDENKSLQITCKIFLDDLEKALRKENRNDNLDIIKDSLLVHTTNKFYLKKNLKLEINGKFVDFNYLGGEQEEDVMWVYLEVEGVKYVESIKLTTSVLTEIYDDQQNMVHFRINNVKRSFILTNEKLAATFEM